jgi:hypothetical protein
MIGALYRLSPIPGPQPTRLAACMSKSPPAHRSQA